MIDCFSGSMSLYKALVYIMEAWITSIFLFRFECRVIYNFLSTWNCLLACFLCYLWVNKVGVIMVFFMSLPFFDFLSIDPLESRFFLISFFFSTMSGCSLVCCSETLSWSISGIAWVNFRLKYGVSTPLIVSLKSHSSSVAASSSSFLLFFFSSFVCSLLFSSLHPPSSSSPPLPLFFFFCSSLPPFL